MLSDFVLIELINVWDLIYNMLRSYSFFLCNVIWLSKHLCLDSYSCLLPDNIVII